MENHFCNTSDPERTKLFAHGGLFRTCDTIWRSRTSMAPYVPWTSGPQVATIQPAFDREQANDNDLNGKAGLRQSEFALER